MIQVQDRTARFTGPKSVRKELRMHPAAFEVISNAAAMVGMDVSTFITSSTLEAAQKVEQALYNTYLDQESFDAFAAACDAEPEPNEHLAAMLKLHDEIVVND
jgi:uncharacterized protein (DUF1778 family)